MSNEWQCLLRPCLSCVASFFFAFSNIPVTEASQKPFEIKAGHDLCWHLTELSNSYKPTMWDDDMEICFVIKVKCDAYRGGKICVKLLGTG